MSAIVALQEAINIKLRRTYTSAEIGDVISALSAAGYAVAPREPTEAMLNACKGAVRSHNQSLRKAGILEKGEFISHESSPAILYRAMLSAAQEPQP